MSDTTSSPERARLAAEILVDTWRELGSDPATYDLVWQAKEYLHHAADTLTPTTHVVDAEITCDAEHPAVRNNHCGLPEDHRGPHATTVLRWPIERESI